MNRNMLCSACLGSLLCLLFFSGAAASAPKATAQAVALVYALQGEAVLASPAGAEQTLRLFDRLPAGTTVRVGQGSRLALAFANGRRYELGERSRANVGPQGLSLRTGPVRALPAVPPLPRLPPIAVAERPGQRAAAVRIRAQRIAGLLPRDGMSSLAESTRLTFAPFEGAGRYEVEVQDLQGRVVFRAETEQTEVTVPARVLHPGARYHWTVRTLDQAGAAARGEADLVTLPAKAAKTRQALSAAVAAEGDGESLSLLAGVDRSLGLLLEARQGLQAALAKSPGNDGLARELAALERLLKEEQDAAGADPAAAARELSDQGAQARKLGDLNAAESLFQQAYAIREKLAPGSLDLASSISDLAVVAALRGDLQTAGEGFAKALEIQQRLAPEGMEMAGTLINLGNIASMRGDFDASGERFRHAIRIIERLRPDDLELARALSSLAKDEILRGGLAVAEDLFRRALAIRQKHATESLEIAGSYLNLGVLAEKRGDCAGAMELHRHSLDMREKLAPGSPYVAESLANLGTAELCAGHLDKADEDYRRALEIYDRSSPGAMNAIAIRIQRADTAVERGDLDLAEELYGQTLSHAEATSPEGLHVVECLEGLGMVAFRRGDLKKAEELLGRSSTLLAKVAPGSRRLGTSLHRLGQVERQAGRLAPAAEHFCRATDAFDQQRKRLGGTPEGRSAFSGTAAEPFRDCVAALVDTGRPEEAFHVLERGRARSFLDLLAERDLRWTADLPPGLAEERRETEADYDRTQAALARLSPARDAAEADRLLVHLRELRARQEGITARVRQASPRSAALHEPQPLDLATARGVLDPGTVLLAWSIGRERSLLFVLQPAGAPGPGLEVFPLSAGDKDLRQRVETFRNLLQNSSSDRAALAMQARELYDMLLLPAQARIAAAEHLLVSPDGPLHTLPFAALVHDGRYLAEEKPVHSVLSATVYAELRRSRRERPAAARLELAAFGDPHYPIPPPGTPPAADPEVRAAVSRGLDLAPLPFTRTEVQSIAALYPGARTFLGTDATEESAKSIGREAGYLHFACHGLLDERSPLSSGLALSIPEHPADGRDNGLLQAWEIFDGMRLDAELVTLSACNTALGGESGGEGLLGLTRAFQYAGARSVLASLWSVSDLATGELMRRFYSHLSSGKTKDEALRAAQIELIRSPRRSLSHPYHWAAFQLFGDWR